MKTGTYILTSTCTSIAIATCIPLSNLVKPTPCARKRQIDYELQEEEEEDYEFSIFPTETKQ